MYDFAELPPGTPLAPLRVTVSPEANRRYFEAAGVTHPSLDADALYPPIAANLTILCLQQHTDLTLIHTRQHLRCHRRADAGTPLVVSGEVVDRYEKSGRAYVDVRVAVAAAADPGDPIWTSEASFTTAQHVA